MKPRAVQPAAHSTPRPRPGPPTRLPPGMAVLLIGALSAALWFGILRLLGVLF